MHEFFGQNEPIEQYLQRVSVAGADLVRGAIRFHRSIEILHTSPLTDEIKAEMLTAVNLIEQFYNAYYPSGYLDKSRGLGSHLDSLLHRATTEVTLDAFSWAREGAASWLQNWQEQHAFVCQTVISELADDLNLPHDLFDLPPNVSDSEIFRFLKASEGFEGLRFLPGYRKLTWGKENENKEAMTVLLSDRQIDGKMWFEASSGRRFFVA